MLEFDLAKFLEMGKNVVVEQLATLKMASGFLFKVVD